MPATGEQLGNYVLKREIGQGTMGEVYVAKDIESEKLVAVKIPNFSVRSNVSTLRQFFVEGKALASLRHPNIVKVLSVMERGDLPFIAMEYVPGKTLADELQEGTVFTFPETVMIIRSLASALDYIHALPSGLVHRDVKPGNIRFRSRFNPVLLDFGIVQMGDRTVLAGSGSAWYMSPEQFGIGRVAGASDQYSLAILAYQILVGDVPINGNYEEVRHSRLSVDAPLADKLSPEIKAVFRIALHREARRRFPSCGDFAEALDAAGKGRAPRKPVVFSQAVGTAVTTKSRAWLPGASVAALVMMLLAAAVLARMGRHPAPPPAPPASFVADVQGASVRPNVASDAVPIAPPSSPAPLAIESVAGIFKASNDWQGLTVRGRGFREGMSVAVRKKPFDNEAPLRETRIVGGIFRVKVLLKESGEYEVRVSDGDLSAAARFSIASEIPSSAAPAPTPIPVEPPRAAPAAAESRPSPPPPPAPVLITGISPATLRASSAPQVISVSGSGFRPDMSARIFLAGAEIGALVPGSFSGSITLRLPGTYEVQVGNATHSFQVLPAEFSFGVRAECVPQSKEPPALPGKCRVGEFPQLGQTIKADADAGVFVHKLSLETKQPVRFNLSILRGWPFPSVMALYDPAMKAYTLMSSDTTLSLNPGNYLVFVASQTKGAGKYSLQITQMGKE